MDREMGVSGAVIKTNRSGISAEWKDAGVTFVGSNLARGEVVYTLTVNSPDHLGVEGSITWKSVSVSGHIWVPPLSPQVLISRASDCASTLSLQHGQAGRE